MSHPETNKQAESVSKVSFYEKRKTIYAKGVRGYFDNWRIGLVLLTQVIFYCCLWLEWNGRQAILRRYNWDVEFAKLLGCYERIGVAAA